MSRPGTIAVIADIHGNLPALRQVVDDIAGRGIDVVVNLGDHLSGPLWPSETAELLMRKPWVHIAGNCDRAVVTSLPSTLGPSDRFAFERLTVPQRDWLAALPPTANVARSVCAVHGTPTDDTSYLLETVDEGSVRLATSAEIEHRLNGMTARVVVCAHSHLPRVVRLGAMLVVNPGSVGLPAYAVDGATPHVMETGSPDARYAVIEARGDEWSAELVCVPYDHLGAANRAERNGRPDWGCALRTGWATSA